MYLISAFSASRNVRKEFNIKSNQPLKDTQVCTRISSEIRDKFYEKALVFGNPSEVLRDIIEAFIDDRYTIIPDPKGKSIYARR